MNYARDERRRRTVGRRTTDVSNAEMKQLIEQFAWLLSWTAQTVHLAHHPRVSNTWHDCSLNICRRIRDGLQRAGRIRQ